jgi:hypothetical protein
MDLNPQQSFKSISVMSDRMVTHAQLEAQVANLRAERDALQAELSTTKDKMAMLVDALTHYTDAMQTVEVGRSRGRHYEEVDDSEIARAALSATAETVADWKAKELSEASVSSSPFGYFRVSQKTGRWEEMTDTEREYSEESGLPLFTAEELTKREAAAKQAGRDEIMKELSEMEPVWYMYRDVFGYWRNFNEAEAGQMVKRGDSWAAFDKMIRRPTYKKG